MSAAEYPQLHYNLRVINLLRLMRAMSTCCPWYMQLALAGKRAAALLRAVKLIADKVRTQGLFPSLRRKIHFHVRSPPRNAYVYLCSCPNWRSHTSVDSYAAGHPQPTEAAQRPSIMQRIDNPSPLRRPRRWVLTNSLSPFLTVDEACELASAGFLNSISR